MSDINHFKLLLPGIITVLAVDVLPMPRRVLVVIKGTDHEADALYRSAGTFSPHPTNIKVKKANEERFLIPMAIQVSTNLQPLTIQFMTLRSLAEHRMKNGVDMEQDEYAFHIVIIVDVDQKFYELDALIPISFYAKQLIVYSTEGASEKRQHIYKILSATRRHELTEKQQALLESKVQKHPMFSPMPVSPKNHEMETENDKFEVSSKLDLNDVCNEVFEFWEAHNNSKVEILKRRNTN